MATVSQSESLACMSGGQDVLRSPGDFWVIETKGNEMFITDAKTWVCFFSCLGATTAQKKPNKPADTKECSFIYRYEQCSATTKTYVEVRNVMSDFWKRVDSYNNGKQWAKDWYFATQATVPITLDEYLSKLPPLASLHSRLRYKSHGQSAEVLPAKCPGEGD